MRDPNPIRKQAETQCSGQFIEEKIIFKTPGCIKVNDKLQIGEMETGRHA